MSLCLLLLFMTIHMAVSVEDLLAGVECDHDPVGYIIPDPLYCDRYLDCDPVTGRNVRLCPTGQVVHQERGLCEDVRKVNCGTRQLWRRINVQTKSQIKNLARGSFPVVTSGPRTVADTTNTVAVATVDANDVVGVVNTVDPLSSLVCTKSEEGYIVHDPTQCDRYAHCSPHGVKTYKLCPDGLVLSLAKGVCDFQYKTDCTGRSKLQEAKGQGACPRENGRYLLPESCNQYVDCRGGEAHVQGCGAGAVFDQVLGCVHPDQTGRPGCNAIDKYEFQCPHFGLQQRFGDHDRLPHPTDCKLYYVCLSNGLPRLNSCKKPMVFNQETGLCEEQSKVVGCEGYYNLEEKTDDVDKDKIVEEVRKQLLKDLRIPFSTERTNDLNQQNIAEGIRLLKDLGISLNNRRARSTDFKAAHSSKTVPFSAPPAVRLSDHGQHVIKKRAAVAPAQPHVNGFAAHAAAEAAVRAKERQQQVPGLAAHAAAEAAVRAQQPQDPRLTAHAAAEAAVRAQQQQQDPRLAAHAAAEAAVRAKQAQFPGTVGASGNIGPSGIVGASGNIGPSGLCGPTGCIAF